MSSQRIPNYAPVGSTIPEPSLSATLNLDEEVQLATTNAEADLMDSLAELYSIIVTLDSLERAHLRDSISDKDYTNNCSRLLKQYKMHLEDETVANAFGDLDSFMKEWEIECPKARDRIRLGLPASMEQAVPLTPAQTSEASTAFIIAATENFITLLDAIKLGMAEKNILHPILVDVMTSVNKVTDQEFEHKAKIVQWLITLNGMKVSEKLNEDQLQQIDFDFHQAYTGFKNAISEMRSGGLKT